MLGSRTSQSWLVRKLNSFCFSSVYVRPSYFGNIVCFNAADLTNCPSCPQLRQVPWGLKANSGPNICPLAWNHWRFCWMLNIIHLLPPCGGDKMWWIHRSVTVWAGFSNGTQQFGVKKFVWWVNSTVYQIVLQNYGYQTLANFEMFNVKPSWGYS